MIRSLRGRLLLGIISGMVVLLLVFSILLYGILYESMMRQLDGSLLTMARMLAALVENEREDESEEEDYKRTDELQKIDGMQEISFEIEVQMIPEFSQKTGSGFYQLQHQDGRIIARSPSLNADRKLEADEASERPRYHWIELDEHKKGRSVCIWFAPQGDNFESAEIGRAHV